MKNYKKNLISSRFQRKLKGNDLNLAKKMTFAILRGKFYLLYDLHT